MTRTIFDSLTPAQRQAVEHLDGPLLILAGPGSGKTRVVTHRIANLLMHDVHPGMILALTFTNKAADEMQDRVARLVPGSNVWIGTFHRFCSRLLRRYASYVGLQSNFTIYDVSDSRQALKRALRTLDLPDSMTTPEKIANQISWLKNQLISWEDFTPRDGNELSGILEDAYPAYQRELLTANAVDFDDLLLHTVTLLRQSPELRSGLDQAYRYVMVDEYQDTNLAQYAIVRALSNDYPNLAVTGDPDQSIYGWRGANLNNILDFEHDFPQVRIVRLEQNYRSTPEILRVAQALISNNVRRKPKELFTANPSGVPVRISVYRTHTEEAEQIVAEMVREIREDGRRPRDFAVLYRVNALSRTFEHVLRLHGLPYQIVNGVEFYQRKEIKDVLAYVHLIYNPQDNSALSRIINVPPRRIGKTTLDRLADYATQRRIALLDAARQSNAIPSISKTAAGRLQAFAAMIDRLGREMSSSLEELLGLILDGTGYLAELRASGTPEDDERAANVEELLAEAREFDEANTESDVIGAFLDRASLVNDIDDWDEQTDRVTLMTLHAAKGLEFPVVYIVGVEHGLLPHERALNMPEQEEEERRLLFVGITRAQTRLQLSYSLIRARRGGLSHTIPSSFLLEMPRREMEYADHAQRRMTRGDAYDLVDYDATADEHSDVFQVDERLADEHAADEHLDVHSVDAHDLANRPDAELTGPEPTMDEGAGRRVDPSPGRRESSSPRPVSGVLLQTAAQLWQPHSPEGPSPVGPRELAVGGADAVTPATDATASPGTVGATPAAAVSTGAPAEMIDPNSFQIGMTITHPTYGLGKIAALSGQGKDRTGTINFALAGQKKFILSKSPVRPVR